MTGLVVGLSLIAIAAPYLLYPVVLWWRATFMKDPIASGEVFPSIDLIICAHDEQASIEAKIANALALEYPADRLEVWIASDGSTDATVEIAEGFHDERIHVLDLPRGGKAAALNAAVAASGAEVLAFSDANSMWQSDALRALVRPLADPRVGGVAGDQRYGRVAGEDTSAGERAHWSVDRQLKRWQSESGSVISATGAIYAVRRTLFQPAPPDATDDFMVSTAVIAAGHRLAFAPDAVAIEPPAESSGYEFHRKVRIITRGLRAVGYRRELLSPFRHGAYAFDLLLHKLWRRLTWAPLLVLVLLTPAAIAGGGWPAIVSILATTGVGVGLLGLAWPRLGRFKPVALASFVVMVSSACAVASLNALRGHRVSRWDSPRATERSSEPGA